MNTKLFIALLGTFLYLSCVNSYGNGNTNSLNDDVISKIQEMNIYYYLTNDTTFLDSMELLLNNEIIDYTDSRFLSYRAFVFAHKNQNREAIDFLNNQIKNNCVDDTVGHILRMIYRNIFLIKEAQLRGNTILAEKYLNENIEIFKRKIVGNETKMVESLYNITDGLDGIAYIKDPNQWIFSGYLIMLAMKDKQLAINEAKSLSEKYPKSNEWLNRSMGYITGLNQYTQLILTLDEIKKISNEAIGTDEWEEYNVPIITDTSDRFTSNFNFLILYSKLYS